MAKKVKQTSYITSEMAQGFENPEEKLVQPKNSFLPLMESEVEAIIQQLRIHKGDNTKGIIVVDDEDDRQELISILTAKGHLENTYQIVLSGKQEEAKLFSFSWGIVLNRVYRQDLRYVKARIRIS